MQLKAKMSEQIFKAVQSSNVKHLL